MCDSNIKSYPNKKNLTFVAHFLNVTVFDLIILIDKPNLWQFNVHNL